MPKQDIYPIANHSPNIRLGFSVLDQLISCSYSNLIERYTLVNELNKLIGIKSPIIADILYTGALRASKQDLKIDFLDKISNAYPKEPEGINGVCKEWGALILVANNKVTSISADSFVHELAHVTMYTAMSPLKAIPYKYADTKGGGVFDKALKTTLLNVKNYLNRNYQMNISFDEKDSSLDIGVKLNKVTSSPDFAIIRGEKEVQELISITGNINAKFLDSQSILQSAIKFNKDDIIKSLLLNGAETKGSGLLKYIVQLNKTDLLEWITINHIKIDVNEPLDCNDNDSAIADTVYPEMVKLLLKAGANFKGALLNAASKNDYIKLNTIMQERPTLSMIELESVKICLENAQKNSPSDIGFIYLLEKYIEQNNTWYNFFATMLSSPEQKKHDEVSCTENTKHVLEGQDLNEACKIFLSFFREINGSGSLYASEDMHAELIVTLPVIISKGIYSGDVQDIMKPLEEYWLKYVSPGVEQYQIKNDQSEFCLGVDSPYSDNAFAW